MPIAAAIDARLRHTIRFDLLKSETSHIERLATLLRKLHIAASARYTNTNGSPSANSTLTMITLTKPIE